MIGQAALGIWMSIEAAGAEDFNAWYPRQHLPERLSVPGFLRGRRYAAVDEAPPYFTLYETADAGVLSSAPYMERLNDPTAWTRRVLPNIRIMVRNAYRALAASTPDVAATDVVTVRIKPDAGRGPAVREWLETQAASALGALPGLRGWGAYVSDTGGTSVQTEERRLVGGEVLPAPPFLALCELAEPGAALQTREFWTAWSRRMAAEVTVDAYRLMYGLAWLRP